MAVARGTNDAVTVATFLYEQVYCVFGPMTSILSDNASHFRAEVVSRLMNLVKSKQKFTSVYKPSTNGMVEKFNGTLVNSLRKLSDLHPKSWDEYIPLVLYVVNQD